MVGVSRRPGEALFSVHVAVELLDKADCSLLMSFVAPADRDSKTEELTTQSSALLQDSPDRPILLGVEDATRADAANTEAPISGDRSGSSLNEERQAAPATHQRRPHGASI